ncbi:MAG: FG-GAP repeat domain-containing protein [Planctomycetota bacterium]
MRFTIITALSTMAAFALAPSTSAQLTDLQPGRNFVSSANFGTGRTENIDAGDCDNDGDMDVIVCNGGDGAAQANRIYINNGGLQGGTIGTFTDATATRFAGVTVDTSRDLEFIDVDADGDLDIYVANRGQTTVGSGEASRFYVNLGGAQAGTIGFFQEQTNTHWGTLISVPAGDQILGGNVGPFRDWSCDCDFADLDDDGDSDLFHSSYGPSINATTDSRIFMNSGAGVFNEAWPWANPAADIRTHSIDLDLMDLDGDFDIDVYMSSRNSQCRTYLNNKYAPISAALFHDVTQTALINQGIVLSGTNNYESEYHDLDGDGDFDIWNKNLNGNLDRIARNNGLTGGIYTFTQMNGWIVGDPNQDENEVDFIDYDGDGDVDSFIANFVGTNWLYQSGIAQGLTSAQGYYHRTGGGGSLAAAFNETPLNNNGNTTLDADAVDIDNDGDDDLIVSNDANQQNFLNTNTLGVPDTHAPTFYQVTNQGNKANGTSTVIHAAIRDNTSYYVMQFYDADLVYTVNGGSPITVSMFAQGSMQYRGVIPAQTDAVVAYHVEVTDRGGNTGVSGTTSFNQGTPGGSPWTDLGFALAGVSGNPLLVGTGALTTGSAGTLSLSNAAPSALTYLFISLSSTPVPFKGGTLATVPLVYSIPIFTSAGGSIPLGWASWPAGLSGLDLFFQYAIQDGAAVAGVALSNALKADIP